MNILGLNINISRNQNSKIQNQKSLAPAAAAWLVGEDSSPSAPLLSSAYEQVVWVYRAINVLAEQIANIPFLFSFGERGREKLITSGPLVDFYNRPHRTINRFQYWELRVLWLMLRGECMRIPIFRDQHGELVLNTGTPLYDRNLNPALNHNLSVPSPSTLHALRSARSLVRVLILDPANFQPVVEANDLLGWRFNGLGHNSPLESQVFLPEEVWFEKLPNPFDFWRGLSPLSVAGLSAKTDFAASSFMRGLIENNAENGLIVRTDQQLSDEQHEQIAAALSRRKRRGVADKSVVLWGATEIVQPRLSSADLQFLENRKFSRAEICAAFGVPEEILTSTDHAKYDVMQGARLNFIENRVAPLCARLEAEEEKTVKALDPTAVGWFDLDSLPIMQAARRARLTAAKTGFDMGVPFNELNRVLDLGFKTLPHGDTCYLPANLQAVGHQSAGRAVPSAPPPARDPATPSLARLPQPPVAPNPCGAGLAASNDPAVQASQEVARLLDLLEKSRR